MRCQWSSKISPREKKRRDFRRPPPPIQTKELFCFSGVGEPGRTPLGPYLKCVHVQTWPTACLPQRDRENTHCLSCGTGQALFQLWPSQLINTTDAHVRTRVLSGKGHLRSKSRVMFTPCSIWKTHLQTLQEVMLKESQESGDREE